MSEEVPFRGRGRGRAVVLNRGAAASPGRPESSSSSSSGGPSQPREPGLAPGVQRLSITSTSTPSAQGSSSTSSSSAGIGSVSAARGARGNRARSRSTSPSGARGARRGFRHESDMVTRPTTCVTKQGKGGVPIALKSNYFALDQAPSWTLYQYRVDIEPQVDSLKLRKGLIKKVFSDANCPIIYVGGDLYSSKKLEDSTTSVASLKNPGEEFKVKVHHVAQVESGDSTYIMVYNQLLRKFMFGMGLTEMGRYFYDVKKAVEIPQHKLTLIPGFITSIRNHENQVLLCVETTTKVIRQDTVLDAINEEKTRGGEFRKNLENLLLNTGVLTPYNDKTYSIASIEWDMTPNSTFPRGREKTEITFVEYYKTVYGLDVTDKSQPLLRAKLSKKDLHRRGIKKGMPEPDVILIPEFCKMTGLTDSMRANFSLMKTLAEHLHAGPQKKVELLREFINKMINAEEVKKELKEWSLGFQKELVKVPGRVLKSQEIIFSSKDQPQPGSDKADWTMAFRNKQMCSVGELKNWTVIVPQRDAGEVDSLIRMMDKVGRPLGLPFPRPQETVKLPNSSPGAYLKALEDLRKKKNDLVFVILPTNKPEPYGTIKRNLTGEQGLVSQCFVAKNMKSKGLMSIATKVVIQINAKLGGEPWTLKWPMKDMMVVGVDVYHGTKTTGGQNVAAMVSTISETYGRYFSTVSMYSTTDELSNAVNSDLMKCLDAYSQFNSEGRLPTKILFFRDGVGEGQLQVLYETELEQVKAALKTHYNQKGQEEPKLTFVVVNKKINTRLFTADGREARNPPPGTVVDDVVTLPERYDFYLIPQTARQGAVSPSAYNVIWDTIDLSPDKIQALTFKFCHMYFNWSGTVAVPAPCQYAHKLANLVGVAVGREAHQKLAYNLHFL